MPIGVFTLYNAVGGLIWIVTFSVLGYVFGRNLPRLVHYIGRVSLVLATLIAVIAGVVFVIRWFTKNRQTVIESLDEGIIAISPRAEIVRLNQSARRLLTLSANVPFSMNDQNSGGMPSRR